MLCLLPCMLQLTCCTACSPSRLLPCHIKQVRRMRRCAAGIHPTQKLCSAKAPPPCREAVALLCPTGDHTLWKECSASKAPRCEAVVSDQCDGMPDGKGGVTKHVVLRKCHELRPACEHCAQAKRNQKRIQAAEARLKRCVSADA